MSDHTPPFMCTVCHQSVEFDDIAVGPWRCGRGCCRDCFERHGQEHEPPHVPRRVREDISREETELKDRNLDRGIR